MSKTAVILFNLGGPDTRESIRPFLLNFFMDKNIIRAPFPVRWLVARLIAWRRTKKEAGDSYGLLGGKSPLLENTQTQAAALQEELGSDHRVFVCMRYWHPMSKEVAAKVKDYAPDQIILMPLYPQFSTTTTGSSYQEWNRAAKVAGLDVPTSLICCYPQDSGFINSSAALIRDAYNQALESTAKMDLPLPRVLFSAHGLPEDIVKDGDPYQWQCEQTARSIAEAMDIPMLDWVICYQSRVGPKKWIGPSTDEAIEAAGADNVPVVIYPHAFVSEHVETLVEIEIEYRELAEKCGVPYFARVETVSDSDGFIKGLADMVRKKTGNKKIMAGHDGLVCPKEYGQCCQRRYEGNGVAG